ncbi:MAG: hypothetical protein ACKOXB_12520 [Flavobacteriales bacterium]
MICPLTIRERGKKPYLRNFVFIPHDSTYQIYEWTYLDPFDFEKDHMEADFLTQVNTLTTWNFSIKTVDDSLFWSNCVLKKEGFDFLYLKELK